MTIRLLIAYALNLFDLAATTYWVNRFGLGIEGNPVGRWLYQTGTVCPVKIIGIGALLIALYWGIKSCPKWERTSWLVLAAYSALTVYHVCLAVCIADVTKGV